MKKLDKIQWNKYSDAYGTAEGIPELLKKIEKSEPSSAKDECWVSLWSRLCHQGDIYTASYAAAPCIIETAEANKESAEIDINFLLLPASIEIARYKSKASEIPHELVGGYMESIKKLGELGKRYKQSADENIRKAALAAILVSENKISEADELLD